MKRSSRPFSYRGFVSMLMAFCFAGLAVSGVILYIAPPCSIAASTNWSVLALSKDQWASLHQVMALVILILALIHLFIFNWKTFCCYLRRRKAARTAAKQDSSVATETGSWWKQIPKEVLVAVIAAIILYAGAIAMIAPFGWLHDGHDAIRDHYRQEMPAGSGEGRFRGEGTEDLRGDADGRGGIGDGRGQGEGRGSGEGRGRDR
ncbi:DUF4405 domain-containing protein [Balneolales bacterium ANBcel1]|nr:DUF4405 domain-containing protein [Balneolales bacterium ANBcel1]